MWVDDVSGDRQEGHTKDNSFTDSGACKIGGSHGNLLPCKSYGTHIIQLSFTTQAVTILLILCSQDRK